MQPFAILLAEKHRFNLERFLSDTVFPLVKKSEKILSNIHLVPTANKPMFIKLE